MEKSDGSGAGLTVTRKQGQAIDIDGPALIRIKRIVGNTAKVQIVAPGSTRILRAELLEVESDGS